ncbi:tol-pal system protein YbgF [Xanthomonas arboricola pv. juglandis]|jgi:tol-pal system protein YbgF|uniref:Cell division coordinator CpoB n=1 Tax=Xanthomonas euroxanthea TaxID=2259622 RepID=A0A6V7N3D7_9XANT|nr:MULTISPECIES: tol-pal system protein YbgF [Xanthomonas]PPT28591.1 tol-pal system protein YbgF [Xanthomonas arboricola]SYZ50322.1 tol-pal system protein YbgF [Xanthomonas arboricola pv. juglandis]PPT43879.1 tol-pal system protein YbgF [Xanthomonas arboricola]CAD1794326.1 tol-pal system protein YbgF [Xanthomonas sp. CPBF 426]CAD1794637.1 tol-pal system protein YbgF [Xanthomonas euroxanthea]
MRFRVTSLFVAAALVVAAPAHAQRASLADRVAVLEQQQANSQANNDLLNQLQQARSDLQGLRATVEQLQHDNEQLKQQSKDQYLDLDGRLNRLEGAGGATPPLPSPTGSVTPAPAPAARPAAAATSEKPPSVHGDPGTMAVSNDERTAYNVAFDALKNGKYDDASQLFLSFLELYPNGVYTPNALYWLGESYYATRNFQLAEAQFRDLVSRYPTHDKASGGLLKLGLSQYGEGKNDEAQQTLQQVATQYPGSDAARVAQERLQSIRLGQQLR